MSAVNITHFSDILCVWAYISQIRLDELQHEFGERVALDYRLFPVFGDVYGKIETQWAGRGGLAGYSKHVLEVAREFEHLEINPRVWQVATPCSSLPSHLYLCAVRVVEADGLIDPGSMLAFKKAIRKAFFVELQDVSNCRVLQELLVQLRIPVQEIQAKIDTGAAYAELGKDIQMGKELSVRYSPTLIFNQDRQRLTGNVGYRIIEANVRELLEHPGDCQSWC